MYNLNRFGQNRPVCNTRQFVTIGIIPHQPEEMRLKPEYLGNEHFKFLNNFGLHSPIVIDKKFVDINNSFNQPQTNHRTILNPQRIVHTVPNKVMVNRTAAYHTRSGPNAHKEASEKSSLGNISEEFTNSINIQKIEDTNKSNMVTNKHEKVNVCSKSSMKGCEDPCSDSNMKVPKKPKRSGKMHYDKASQKLSKKSKRQKHFHKQSKRESDRNVIGSSQSSRKRKNCKPWHKESLKMEIMDVSDGYFCSSPETSLDSPIIASICNTSLPSIQSVCVKNKITCLSSLVNKINICLSSPVKVNREPTKQKHSPSGCNREEQQSDACQSMGYPSEQNNCQLPKQNNFRPRLPSECESEDSFIVFEEDSKSTDLEDDRDSTDFDMSSDEDSDDSDIDFCITSYDQNNHILKASSPIKKVRFAMGKDLCEVHPMVQWSFAYQKARKGPWEQFAVDRMRFKNRVADVQPVLDVILQPAHRDKVYRERFQHDSSDKN